MPRVCWGSRSATDKEAAMSAAAEERIKQLTARMLRRKLYVVLSTPKAGPDEIVAVLPAHLEYMIGLEKQGVLFASGPFADPDGKSRGQGMTILRTATMEEARRIAESDPFVAAGLRNFEVREWTLMEGSLGVTVNFSDQSVQVR
jgi:uncharacterized protein YciI